MKYSRFKPRRNSAVRAGLFVDGVVLRVRICVGHDRVVARRAAPLLRTEMRLLRRVLYPSVCISIYLYVCLSINIAFYLYLCLSICLSIYLSSVLLIYLALP